MTAGNAPPNHHPDVTGVILAGGKSSRMGRDKATLTVDGHRLFDVGRQMLEKLFQRVIISGNRPDLAGADLPYFPDIFPGSALGGLYTALYYAHTPYIFATACDLPFPDESLARTLLAMRRDHDAVVFKTPTGLEPMFALYGKKALKPMRVLLGEQHYRIYDLFDHVKTCYVELGAEARPVRALFNMNTQEDYRWATSVNKGLATKEMG